MNKADICEKLKQNAAIFESLLGGLSNEEILWKPKPEKWCLLEVVCHLLDEEREDFRARIKHILDSPNNEMPKIAPQDWVIERRYLEQDFDAVKENFLQERESSIEYLNGLTDADFEKTFVHPNLGKVSASMFLENWLMHDFIHIRQIINLTANFFRIKATQNLDYAGNW